MELGKDRWPSAVSSVHFVGAAAASSHKELRLRGITEVLPARREIFGEDSFGK